MTSGTITGAGHKKAMPYANNQGVHIHYKIEGGGQPLVLCHGLGGSLDDYYEFGYVAALEENYQLILIDSRGHGASDKPHYPEAYRMSLCVADVVAVLDDLCISKAHYFGYSMGGWMGFGIAKYTTDRFYSLIIGGAHPYEEAIYEPNPLIPLLKNGIAAVVAAYESAWGPRLTSGRKSRLLTTDAEALIALLSMRQWERLGFEDILSAINMPCLLFAGEATSEYLGARECVRHIPNATFISLPGFDHYDAYYRSNIVLPHITKFLVEVSRNKRMRGLDKSGSHA